jgi:hypothetical protein
VTDKIRIAVFAAFVSLFAAVPTAGQARQIQCVDSREDVDAPQITVRGTVSSLSPDTNVIGDSGYAIVVSIPSLSCGSSVVLLATENQYYKPMENCPVGDTIKITGTLSFNNDTKDWRIHPQGLPGYARYGAGFSCRGA